MSATLGSHSLCVLPPCVATFNLHPQNKPSNDKAIKYLPPILFFYTSFDACCPKSEKCFFIYFVQFSSCLRLEGKYYPYYSMLDGSRISLLLMQLIIYLSKSPWYIYIIYNGFLFYVVGYRIFISIHNLSHIHPVGESSGWNLCSLDITPSFFAHLFSCTTGCPRLILHHGFVLFLYAFLESEVTFLLEEPWLRLVENSISKVESES